MANELIQARLSSLTMAEVDQKIKALGINRSELVNMALEITVNFDIAVLKELRSFGDALHIPLWLVMQNLLIARMAEQNAEDEVFGPAPRLSLEFMNTTGGVITGKELFDLVKASEIKRITNTESYKQKAYWDHVAEQFLNNQKADEDS